MGISGSTGKTSVNITGSVNAANELKDLQVYTTVGTTYPAAGKYWIVVAGWAYNDGSASTLDWYIGSNTAVGANCHGDVQSTATPPYRLLYIKLTNADCIRIQNNAGFTYYEFSV